MPSRHRRPAGSDVGATPLRRRDVPADLQPYRLTDWRTDHQRMGGAPGEGNGNNGWVNNLHGTAGGGGPKSMPYDLVPIDMHPRVIREYSRGPNGQLVPGGLDVAAGMSPLYQYLQQIARDTRDISSTQVIERGLIARVVSVPTTPVLVADAQFLRGYIFLNPATSAGLTTAGTLLPSALRSVDGTSSSLGVANYLSQHFFLDVTASTGAGTLDIIQQALDPTSLTFCDVQTVATITAPATGCVYGFAEQFGVGTDMRVRFTISGGSTFTFSVGFVLKNGLAGTSTGVNQTIFLGSSGVTTETGFPLLEGDKEKFFLRENTQLFAVASSTLDLRVFEL